MNVDEVFARIFSLQQRAQQKAEREQIDQEASASLNRACADSSPATTSTSNSSNLSNSSGKPTVVISQYRKAKAEQEEEEFSKFTQLQRNLLSEKQVGGFVKPQRIKILTIGKSIHFPIVCLSNYKKGSRGDVQPFIAFAKGLKKAGHSVTIVTHDAFKYARCLSPLFS